jgi:hypothetical protein
MVSINGIPCVDMDHTRAKELVLTSPNRVTLMAISPTPYTATSASTNTNTTTSPTATDIDVISMRYVLTELSSSRTHDEDPVLAMAQAVSSRRSLSFQNFNNQGTASDNNNTYSSSLDVHLAYFSVMVVKPSSDMKLGIQLKDVNGMAVISKIVPNSSYKIRSV